MDSMNYTDFRSSLAHVMETVCEDHVPMLVTRQNAKPVVILSLEDFNAYEETAYLLKSPKNARRLFKSLEEMATGTLRPAPENL